MDYLTNFVFSVTGAVYLLLWILCFAAWYYGGQRIDRVLSALVTIFTLIALGLRDQRSGTDTQAYLLYFDQLSSDRNVDFVMEPMFELLTRFLAIFGSGSFYIFCLVLFQLLLVYCASILLNVANRSVILISFVSFLPGLDLLTNGVRQGFGICFLFFLWALLWCKKRSLSPLLGAAFLFHKSLYIYMAFVFIPDFKDGRIVIKLSYTLFFLSAFIFASWSFFDASIVADKFASILDFSISGTTLSLGEKAGIYIGNDQDILQGIYKYYFLLISLVPVVAVFFVCRFNSTLNQFGVVTSKLILLLALMLVPYAIAWPSPFAYRFMYLSYIPAIFVCYSLVNKFRIKKWMACYMISLLVSSVLVYGSSTYAGFRFSFDWFSY